MESNEGLSLLIFSFGCAPGSACARTACLLSTSVHFASAMTRPAQIPIVIMRWGLRVGTGEFVSDTHSLDIEREITPKQYLSQLFQVMHLTYLSST
jgi:hypothetical protein